MNRDFPSPGRFSNWRDWADEFVKRNNRVEANQPVNPQTILLATLLRQLPNSLATDGLMMYDPSEGSPVFSRGGQWHPVASGQSTESGVAEVTDTTATQVFEFDEPYASAPVVVGAASKLGIDNGFALCYRIVNVSPTGFSVRLHTISPTGTVTPTTGTLNWIAMGDRE